VDESPHRSHRLRGLDPIMEVQPPLRKHNIGDKEFEGSYVWFEETCLVKLEVVGEHPPPNFNPPLTKLDTSLLVQVREIFSEPFSLFSHPPTMLGPSVSSSVSEP
jgi:hypothetical protein